MLHEVKSTIVICSTLMDRHSLEYPYSIIHWDSAAFVQRCKVLLQSVAHELDCQAVVHLFICSFVYCSISFTLVVWLEEYIVRPDYHFYLLSVIAASLIIFPFNCCMSVCDVGSQSWLGKTRSRHHNTGLKHNKGEQQEDPWKNFKEVFRVIHREFF